MTDSSLKPPSQRQQELMARGREKVRLPICAISCSPVPSNARCFYAAEGIQGKANKGQTDEAGTRVPRNVPVCVKRAVRYPVGVGAVPKNNWHFKLYRQPA